jgi:hypothetical protein
MPKGSVDVNTILYAGFPDNVVFPSSSNIVVAGNDLSWSKILLA